MEEERTGKDLKTNAMAKLVIDAKDYDAIQLILKSLQEIYSGRLFQTSIRPNQREQPFPDGVHCHCFILPEGSDIE